METQAIENKQNVSRVWLIIFIVFFAAFNLAAALNYLRISGGFLTNYLADISGPAMLYIIYRELYQPRRSANFFTRYIGATPETCAIVMFAGSTFTEICQYYWPRGIFRGYFDPLDILAYAIGVGACYAYDKWTLPRFGG